MTAYARPRSAGFTLVEALVALAIVAIGLAAIGSLAASNIRGTARLERQLALIETTGAVLNSFAAQRSELFKVQAGRLDGYRWQSRFRATPQQDSGTSWTPQTVVVSVQSPSGQEFQIETVRLRQMTGRAR